MTLEIDIHVYQYMCVCISPKSLILLDLKIFRGNNGNIYAFLNGISDNYVWIIIYKITEEEGVSNYLLR